MSQSLKVYAAVFRDNTKHYQERIEYFCDKDIKIHSEGASPEEYATNFLLEEGEWLDTVIDEEPITDPVEVIGVLESALEYVRTMTQDGEDERKREIKLRQRLEKLLVSYVATST